ncbi:MAG: AAA family ATPase, partial [Candidatus Aenigmatarchaeota archaeon]
MIIESVKLKNFKSHGETKIDFGHGINVILGENGAGKTSILEAISFGLFKDYQGNAEKLMRSGSQRMEVQVAFSSAGRRYRVVRKRSKGVSESILLLIEGGAEKEIRSGESGVDEEISTILGIDRHMFANAIYVRQGEIEKLLTETPFRKKQLIGKLIGIEALEKAWEGMKPIIDVYRERKALVEGQIMKEDETRGRVADGRQQIAETDERMAKTTQRIADLEKKLSKEKAREEKLSEAEGRYAGLRVKKGELSEMISREEKRLSETKKQLAEAERASLKLASVGKEISSRNSGELSSLERNLLEKVSDAAGRIGMLAGRISETSGLEGKLSSSSGACPLCGSELTQMRRKELEAERNAKMEKMRKEMAGLSVAKKADEKELEKVRREIEKVRALEKSRAELLPVVGRLASLSGQAADGGKIVFGLREKLSALGSELKGEEAFRKEYTQAKELSESIRREAGALREAYGRQQGKLQELRTSLA